jgi:hypothetical protein
VCSQLSGRLLREKALGQEAETEAFSCRRRRPTPAVQPAAQLVPPFRRDHAGRRYTPPAARLVQPALRSAASRPATSRPAPPSLGQAFGQPQLQQDPPHSARVGSLLHLAALRPPAVSASGNQPLSLRRERKKKTQQSRANSAARAALGRPCSWLCMRTSTANLGRPCRARRVWFQGLGTKGHGGSKRGSLERAGCDAANNCGPLKCPSGAECSPNAWRLTKRCITSTVPRGQCLRGRKAHKCGHRNCDSPSQPTYTYTLI